MKQNHLFHKIIAFTAALVVLLSATACRRKADSESGSSTDPSSLTDYVSSAPAVPVSVEEPTDNGIGLVISSPTKTAVSVTDPHFTFSGTSDPAEPLTVNGTEITRTGEGVFSYATELKVGKNTFRFLHKGKTYTYTVTYRYVIINSYAPSGAQTYPSGSTIVASVSARRGSTVTAVLNGETISLTAAKDAESAEGEFINYNGVFKLPRDNAQNINLGKITYKASHDGKSESFSSGNITCRKTDAIIDYDPNATPTGGKYINVGSGYIAEITAYSAETFNGNVSEKSIKDGSVDWSRPTNNYLPKGTLDYCSSSYISFWESGTEKKYITLRAGYLVYLDRKVTPYKDKRPVTRQYIGSLPDHNEITAAGLTETETHTVLTFDALWKAPFYFDLLPQQYQNPSAQNYQIDTLTCNYIDITFCYATVFGGEIDIPADDPLFSSAKIIENKNADGSNTRDYTLRLFLKKQGGFYGWDSYYNENNQLCFEFLHPRTVTPADNEYGVNLGGAKILIDVGHGGADIGAPGFDAKNHNEAIQNLFLANKIKAELEKIGARVVLTRTNNGTTSSSDDKIPILKREKPDFCLSVHHNSSAKSTPNGFYSYYFTPISKKAAEDIYFRTRNTGNSIYKKFDLGWHTYYMARMTNCPSVLTENGYMSNAFDYGMIISDAKNTEKAKAITRGIVDYFNAIQ